MPARWVVGSLGEERREGRGHPVLYMPFPSVCVCVCVCVLPSAYWLVVVVVVIEVTCGLVIYRWRKSTLSAIASEKVINQRALCPSSSTRYESPPSRRTHAALSLLTCCPPNKIKKRLPTGWARDNVKNPGPKKLACRMHLLPWARPAVRTVAGLLKCPLHRVTTPHTYMLPPKLVVACSGAPVQELTGLCQLAAYR